MLKKFCGIVKDCKRSSTDSQDERGKRNLLIRAAEEFAAFDMPKQPIRGKGRGPATIQSLDRDLYLPLKS